MTTIMSCPRCGFEIQPERTDCAACGIVFARYDPQREQETVPLLDARREAQVADAVLLMSPTRPLRWVATLQTISGAIYALLALLMLYIARERSGLFTLVVVYATLAALCVWVSRAIRRLEPAGLIVLLGMTFLTLLAFPIGTVLALILLVYLFHPGMAVLFSGQDADRLGTTEIGLLHDLHEARAGVWFIRTTVAAIVLTVGVAAIVLVTTGVAGWSIYGDVVRAQRDMAAIDRAVRAYAMHERAYPPPQPIGDLIRAMDEPLPAADPWGRPYRYERLGSGFRLGSAGPDGRWSRRSLADYGAGAASGDDIVVEDGEVVGRTVARAGG